jgi:phenylalanyl-tRNA synthetase beta chain
MLISYNWLKKYIKNIPPAEELESLITFKVCELENVEKLPSGDVLFDLNVLPDRAHDLLSHKGVAKEIAGLLGLLFEGGKEEEIKGGPTKLEIEIKSPLCRRYVGRIIRNIEIGPSPDWLVKLLESIGQRSINNIVDITNFILFDTGQPVHAFDLSKLVSPKIIVRQANAEEKINLLSFDSREDDRLTSLSLEDLVISDEAKALAIAGVKGGEGSGVSSNTTDILIEVANFDPVGIRRTARRLGIMTDAVKRYENEISPNICLGIMNQISSLIKETCPQASFEEIVDKYQQKREDKKVYLERDYVSQLLGIDIAKEEIEKILNNYGYDYIPSDSGWEIMIPDERLDIDGPHDLVEEIGRVYGYDKIEPVLPKIEQQEKDDTIWQKINIAKNRLIKDGYKEVLTSVFRDKGKVSILAAASDKSFLRDNLTDGLRESIDLNIKNLPLLNLDEVKIFEVGTVFLKDKEEIRVAYGDKKNIIEKPLLEFVKGIESEGYDLVFNKDSQENNYFEPWSVYPFITRDIAVWVSKETDPSILVDIYKDFGGQLLVKEPKLIDKFAKEDRVSYNYRLVFQSKEKTLTDAEIAPITEAIYTKLNQMGFEIR